MQVYWLETVKTSVNKQEIGTSVIQKKLLRTKTIKFCVIYNPVWYQYSSG